MTLEIGRVTPHGPVRLVNHRCRVLLPADHHHGGETAPELSMWHWFLLPSILNYSVATVDLHGVYIASVICGWFGVYRRRGAAYLQILCCAFL